MKEIALMNLIKEIRTLENKKKKQLLYKAHLSFFRAALELISSHQIDIFLIKLVTHPVFSMNHAFC